MATSNHERVGKALELLNQGLKPFVERELRAVHGERWLDAAQGGLREGRTQTRGNDKAPRWDTQTLLAIGRAHV